jgi:hypothetical protein
MASVATQGDKLVCATDGTYKWTLVDCSSEAVVWTRGSFVHQFVPWTYMFVHSETTAPYVQMFQVIGQRALDFFGVDINVAYGSLDHSEAIAFAFEEVWPDVCLLICWPHLARRARKKKYLLSNAEVYDAKIKPQLQLLWLARTHAQFVMMSVLVTDHWIASGERRTRVREVASHGVSDAAIGPMTHEWRGYWRGDTQSARDRVAPRGHQTHVCSKLARIY